MKAFIAAVAGLSMAGAASANIILDFEALEVVNNAVNSWGYTYDEDGYRVADKDQSGPELATFGTLEARYPGSTAMFNNGVSSLTVLSAIDGSSFDLVSMEIANLNLSGPVTVSFTGYLAGGGTVFQQFTTSYNNQNILEKVTFNWTGLSSVEWSQDSPFHQFDNITIVPVPASLALLGLGGLALRRRR